MSKRPLSALLGLLAWVPFAPAAPEAPRWPEPARAGLRLLEGPDRDGRFRAQLVVEARQRLEDLYLDLAPTPGVELDSAPPSHDGGLAAGARLEFEVRGRVEPGTFPLAPGLSLAYEYRYCPKELRAALARSVSDREGVEAYLAAQELGDAPAQAHRVRFLALVPRPPKEGPR